jgi:hypothetical protein
MISLRNLGLACILAAAACGGAQKAAQSAAGVADVQKKIDANCPADKVGALPTQTPEQKAGFTDMIGKVLGGLLSKVDFVNQLVAKNPGSENAVKCAADQIPEPTPAQAPAK